ncbi:MAG: ribonuclease D, partial [Bacteroidota bacterium]
FIGEKRYHTLLCLIQISCEHGYYLLDPIAIENLDPFLDILEDPEVVIITHAGDNDYRLLNRQYDLIPQNVFDTQVAAGFIGHRYPMSFAKLVEAETGDVLGKGYAVTDWSQRPMSQKQIKYALNDVIYLRALYDTITGKLEANGRLSWALEECGQMATEQYYYRDPNHEFLNSNIARSSRTKDRLFLLRLYEWRRSTAEKKNYSKEMILQSKLISQLVRGVRGGLDSMLDNRRLPQSTVKRYGKLFVEMYNREATEEEKAIVSSIKRNSQDEEEDDMLVELLYLIMKYRAGEADISHALVMPRNAIKRMKQDAQVRQSILGSGWRSELLGSDFVNWLANFEKLSLKIEGGKIWLEF